MRKISEILITSPVKHVETQLNNPEKRRPGKLILVVAIFFSCACVAQDSTRVLEEVRIEAFRYDRGLLEIPVSADLIGEDKLSRFNNASLLPAVNLVSGVRMEERSPGSYRLSIRGSLMRSPFGVRNVKVYWKGLPLTDGGGNTYVNLLDVAGIGSMEIIKGPGSSLYGAGTGGVVMFRSRKIDATSVSASAMIGSYGLRRYSVGAQLNQKQARGSISYARQQSDGDREHTRMERDAINADWTFQLSQQTYLAMTIFHTNVYYQTPGGLTEPEFATNPKAARPPAGPNPGAAEQKASVRNKSTYAGVTLDHSWNPNWSTRAGVFGAYTDFRNFAIRNLEERFETNLGIRVENQYTFGINTKPSTITFGIEGQLFYSPFFVYQNMTGTKGSKTFTDDLQSQQGLIFLQTELPLPFEFALTAGASVNFLRYEFNRLFPESDQRSMAFAAEFSPRIALLRKINKNVSAFASVSRGFSPPTLAEVRPSTEVFNKNLEAETGINTEVGLRVSYTRFNVDLTAYDFGLRNTIVIQRVEDGAEYFINAGETNQRGIELSARWTPIPKISLSTAYTYNHYRFAKYVKDGEDFSGMKLTGVPPVVFSVAADAKSSNGLYLNVTSVYTDHIPLNDANTAFAEPYVVVNLRAGLDDVTKNGLRYEVFCGVNNLLDQTYSLGNDLNAFGGRYYNVAPGIGYFAGLKFTVEKNDVLIKRRSQ